MNKTEWQQWFDERFPQGASMTGVGPDEQIADDSPQDLIYPPRVVEVEEDDSPTVDFFFRGQDRGMRVDVERVEERWFGCTVFPEGTAQPILLLSNKFTEEQRKFIEADDEVQAELRKEFLE